MSVIRLLRISIFWVVGGLLLIASPVWSQQSSASESSKKTPNEKAEKKVNPDVPEITTTEDGAHELFFPADPDAAATSGVRGAAESANAASPDAYVSESQAGGGEGSIEEMPYDEGPPIDSELLLPEDIPSSTEAIPTANQPSSIEVARKNRNRYVEVRARVERDPQVVEMFEKSEKAKTTEDYRAARREYYRLVFEKMRQIDPSLKSRCDLMEDAYLRRLEQSRVEPTIPLNPPPTPAPLE